MARLFLLTIMTMYLLCPVYNVDGETSPEYTTVGGTMEMTEEFLTMAETTDMSGSTAVNEMTTEENTESGNTESGNTESGSTESGNTQGGSTQSGSTQNGNTQSGSTQSGNTQSGSTEGGEGTVETTTAGNHGTQAQGNGESTATANPSAATATNSNGGGNGNNGNGGGTTAGNNGNNGNGGGTTAGNNGNNGGYQSVKLTLAAVSITNPDDAVLGLETGQHVEVDVSVVIPSDSNDISGSSNWQFLVGLTNGSTTHYDDDSVGYITGEIGVLEPETDVGYDLAAGNTKTFSVSTTLSLGNVTECVYSHLCVMVNPTSGSNWYPDYDNSVIVKCQQVFCSGVSIKLHMALAAVVMAAHALHKGLFCS